jgi:hypothetical protein
MPLDGMLRHASRFLVTNQAHKHAEGRGMLFFKSLLLHRFLACRPIERKKIHMSVYFFL